MIELFHSGGGAGSDGYSSTTIVSGDGGSGGSYPGGSSTVVSGSSSSPVLVHSSQSSQTNGGSTTYTSKKVYQSTSTGYAPSVKSSSYGSTTSTTYGAPDQPSPYGSTTSQSTTTTTTTSKSSSVMNNPDHDPSIDSAISKLRKLMSLVKKYFKLLMLRKRSNARRKSITRRRYLRRIVYGYILGINTDPGRQIPMRPVDKTTRRTLNRLVRKYYRTRPRSPRRRRIVRRIIRIIRRTIRRRYYGPRNKDLPNRYPGDEKPTNVIVQLLRRLTRRGRPNRRGPKYFVYPRHPSPGRKPWIFYPVRIPKLSLIHI